jgi:formiminoglutamase
MKNYKSTNSDIWQGRVDSETNYDAFRWHQWIELIDLRDNSLKPFTGKLGFALLGFCCDEGIKNNLGRVGAAKGPMSIRKELANLPCSFTEDVKIFDVGNILFENSTLEETQLALSEVVEKILELNLFPIILGGGHEIAFGHYMGLRHFIERTEVKPKIGIINFDAHFDIRPYPNGTSSGTMFRQIADICEEDTLDFSYFCLGIQKRGNTIDLFKTADRLGAKYILARDIVDSNILPILEQLDDFIKLQNHIYITICSDVFSSAFAPGVSAAQPLGLNPEKVLKLLKFILRSDKTISFDIAEVAPRFDYDNTTANLAAIIVFAVINTLAKGKGLAL